MADHAITPTSSGVIVYKQYTPKGLVILLSYTHALIQNDTVTLTCPREFFEDMSIARIGLCSIACALTGTVKFIVSTISLGITNTTLLTEWINASYSPRLQLPDPLFVPTFTITVSGAGGTAVVGYMFQLEK